VSFTACAAGRRARDFRQRPRKLDLRNAMVKSLRVSMADSFKHSYYNFGLHLEKLNFFDPGAAKVVKSHIM